MKATIQNLKKEFPLVNFFEVDHVLIHWNGDACYPKGAPEPVRIQGKFIRIENPMGGADAVRASDVEEIRRVAAWHQARAEASGFGA